MYRTFVDLSMCGSFWFIILPTSVVITCCWNHNNRELGKLINILKIWGWLYLWMNMTTFRLLTQTRCSRSSAKDHEQYGSSWLYNVQCEPLIWYYKNPSKKLSLAVPNLKESSFGSLSQALSFGLVRCGKVWFSVSSRPFLRQYNWLCWKGLSWFGLVWFGL